MVALLRLLPALLATPFRSKSSLEAENAALHQQIIVLRRKFRGLVKFSNADRLFFVWLCRLLPAVTPAMLIIRPDTLVRWLRAGFRRYWRWKSRGRIGRPKMDYERLALIRRMSAENSLWGAPRIRGELLKLGFDVAQSTVAKYMGKRRVPPSQTGRTLLRNHAPDICCYRSLCRAHHQLRTAVWFDRYPDCPTQPRSGQHNGASHSGVGRSPIDRGVPVAGSAATPHPRLRCHLWKRRSETSPLNGDTRLSDRAATALAEPACRTAHRLDPARMSRLRRGHWGSAPAPDPSTLRRLLQLGADTSVAGEGLSAASSCSGDWGDLVILRPRQTSSRLYSDVIFGTQTVPHQRICCVGRPGRRHRGNIHYRQAVPGDDHRSRKTPFLVPSHHRF